MRRLWRRFIAELKVPAVVQDRMEDFAERNTEGLLSAEEFREYEFLIDLCGLLSLAKAKAIGHIASGNTVE